MSRLLVISMKNSLLQVFDVATKKKMREINLPAHPHEILVDPHHRHLAYVTIPYREGIYNDYTGDGHEVIIVDLNEYRIKDTYDLRPNHSRPHGMFFGPQTGYLYVSCESNNGELLRMDTNQDLKILTSIPTHAHGPHWFTILPSEKKAYTANKEIRFVSVLDLVSNKFLCQIDAPNGSENIGCSHDGRLVFLSTLSTSKDLCLVDTESDTIIHRITLDYPPSAFELSPNNSSLIYVRHMNINYDQGLKPTDNGYLQEIDIHTRKIGRQIKLGYYPLNMVITNDGKCAYLSCALSDRIEIIDLNKMEIIGNINPGPLPHGLAFAD